MQKALLFAALTAVSGFCFSGTALAQNAEIRNPAEPFVSNPQPRVAGGGMIPSGATCGDTLFENGPLVNSPGTAPGGADESLLQDSTLSMGTFGFAHSTSGTFRVADDFTVPAGGMSLGCVVLYAYQTGSTTTSTITTVNLQIWNGQPGAMGSTVVFGDTTTNRLSSTSWTNIYRGIASTPGATNRPIMAQVVDLSGLNLPAGTYWLDWQTGGSLGSGPWAPPITINGQSSTGNARQFDGTNWADLTDVGPQGLPFALLAPPGAPTLSLGSANLGFGNVVNGQSGNATLTVSNTGTAALSISALTAPVAPFALSGGTCGSLPISLAPDASCTLVYSFSPTSATASSQAITVTSNGGNVTFNLQGTGVTGLPPAVPRPAVVPATNGIGLGILILLTLGFAGWSLQRRD